MMNEELIEKAKKARSAEQPSPKSDELSDDALDNVSGGYEQLGRTYAQLARTEKPKPSNNDTNELPDDALDIVSGGEGASHAVPALRQCPNCGALYPMNDICPNCTAISKHEAQE